MTLNKGQPLPGSLFIFPMTPQIQGLHTVIRNKDTPRDEFVFYSQRLMRLVIEFAMSLLPFKVNFHLSYIFFDDSDTIIYALCPSTVGCYG